MDAPGPVKLRLVCSRVNGGGEPSRVELAPADHYGVAWTPEFKTRMEKFLGNARYELRATNQIARQKKKPWQPARLIRYAKLFAVRRALGGNGRFRCRRLALRQLHECLG